MMELPTLDDWVWVKAVFTQASIGLISNNFRQVTLSFNNQQWVLGVVLELDSEEDRENIDDIVDESAVLLTDISEKTTEVAQAKIIAHIEVSNDALIFTPDTHHRILFRRQESISL